MSLAVSTSVDLAALGPQVSVERYIAASYGRIAEALGASGGYLAIAARVSPPDGDPLWGWRMVGFYAVGPDSQQEVLAVEHVLREDSYLQDPVVQNVVRAAGRHRVYHDPDPRTVPEGVGTIDLQFWNLLGLEDRMKLVYALAPDVELHLGIDRRMGLGRFAGADEQFLDELIHGLRPWAQRVALLHGYLAGREPLSMREREVACALLGHAPPKEFAGALGISEARAREIVRAVYRKLRVRSRAELASVWAGQHANLAAQPVATARTRRSVRRG
jgi:DNA-binding CsgD family transcriptional regulator